MGGQIIDYSFFREKESKFDTPQLVCVHPMLQAFRPVVGSELTLPGVSNTLYRVVRVEPSDNPAGNSRNKYFLVIVGSKSDGFATLRETVERNQIL